MKYVDKKGIKNIQFTGHLEDVTDYYNTIDAFILTSKIEGTPISIIEAMAFGLPIFTTDVGEIRANFGHLDNFHFLTGNIKEDVEILSKNFEKRCLFNNLREYVLENHSSRLNSNLFFNILLENMLITAPADPNKMMLNGTYY
jgi:glycosyltransferase involved in cell wall biosynthesis